MPTKSNSTTEARGTPLRARSLYLMGAQEIAPASKSKAAAATAHADATSRRWRTVLIAECSWQSPWQSTLVMVITLLTITLTEALYPLTWPNGTAVQMRGCTEQQKVTEDARSPPSNWCKITEIAYDTRTNEKDCKDETPTVVVPTTCKQLSSGKYKRYECLQVDGEETFRYYYNTYQNEKQCLEAGTPGSPFDVHIMSVGTVVSPDTAPKCEGTGTFTGSNIDCSYAFPPPACIFGPAELKSLGGGGEPGDCWGTIDAGESCIPGCKDGYRKDTEQGTVFECGYGAPKKPYYEGTFSKKTICKRNTCYCEHGKYVDICLDHNEERCKKDECNAYYHSEPRASFYVCEKNICECNHGTAVNSSACAKDSENNCQKCEPEFELQSGPKETKECAPKETKTLKSGSSTALPRASLLLVISAVAIFIVQRRHVSI